MGGTADQLKSKVPSPDQIFIWGDGVLLQTNTPEILEWGHSRNFEQNSGNWNVLEHGKLTKVVEKFLSDSTRLTL